MKGKVFISGPIQGVEQNQSYREVIRDICSRCDYEAIDPWLREKVIYRGSEPNWWRNVPPKGFIERDLRDIEKCDIFVAYLPRLSAGTCMELFYAKLKGKRTITICGIENPSPWITEHSDVIIKRTEDLEDLLRKEKHRTDSAC